MLAIRGENNIIGEKRKGKHGELSKSRSEIPEKGLSLARCPHLPLARPPRREGGETGNKPKKDPEETPQITTGVGRFKRSIYISQYIQTYISGTRCVWSLILPPAPSPPPVCV